MSHHASTDVQIGIRFVEFYMDKMGLNIKPEYDAEGVSASFTYQQVKAILEALDRVSAVSSYEGGLILNYTTAELLALGKIQAVLQADWEKFISPLMDDCTLTGRKRREYVTAKCAEYRLVFS